MQHHTVIRTWNRLKQNAACQMAFGKDDTSIWYAVRGKLLTATNSCFADGATDVSNRLLKAELRMRMLLKQPLTWHIAGRCSVHVNHVEHTW